MKKFFKRLLPSRPSGGFTMIELLVVVTIIIVITSIGLVSYTTANQSARNAKRKSDLASVKNALVLYRVQNDQYPNTNSFTTMLTTIDDYIDNQNISDPGSGNYTYSSSGGGSCFTLQAQLEPDSTVYRLTCP